MRQNGKVCQMVWGSSWKEQWGAMDAEVGGAIFMEVVSSQARTLLLKVCP